MKRFRIIYFLMVFSLLYMSCSKEDSDNYYSVLGTVEKTGDNILIISDDDERLLINNKSMVGSLIDEDRVIAYFTMVDVVEPEGVDYVIDIYSYTKVVFKPVIVLTPQIADSIGNDPLDISDIWVAKDYLNVDFNYYGGSAGIKHYINLIRYPGEISTDTIDLEIRHNDNSDSQGYLLRGFVTFDLSSLKNPGDSVVLRIKAKEISPPDFDQHLVYKF